MCIDGRLILEKRINIPRISLGLMVSDIRTVAIIIQAVVTWWKSENYFNGKCVRHFMYVNTVRFGDLNAKLM